MAEELTVRLPGCNLEALDTDQVKVDCNTECWQKNWTI
jgi:hypothetical protein